MRGTFDYVPLTTLFPHLQKAIAAGGVEPKLLALVHLRASQINGCSACVYDSVAGGGEAGNSDERLHNVAAWREAPFYTEAERAALALAEAATRLQDGAPGVTDEIWQEVNAHFTEEQIGALDLEIALTNFFNRINRTIKEPAGKTWD
ncbi:carboxymuconolactone decarboxylase family protein [Streptomyces anthocyanicus]|uniref:carboxymuconolactone decarboxylase family protein n=1 Tax=Streptomyces anthocyanicus TaxID=68174 RepID=UPI002DD8677C|nr:carboxymuconolactone decarboxylase family protein [Streptomyces anthocyanicus]WSB58749.1 carboxymuconolactone decarboxylase family protein [Streptomyces anthocyanicus]WSB65920.1 carboxymuconolactone decarboxylase family protein [Streptomyces anthocyanicus]